jgi:hypothetical protein
MNKNKVWAIILVLSICIVLFWLFKPRNYQSTSAAITIIDKVTEEQSNWIDVTDQNKRTNKVEVDNNSIWRLIEEGNKYTIVYSTNGNGKSVLKHIAPANYSGYIN